MQSQAEKENGAIEVSSAEDALYDGLARRNGLCPDCVRWLRDCVCAQRRVDPATGAYRCCGRIAYTPYDGGLRRFQNPHAGDCPTFT